MAAAVDNAYKSGDNCVLASTGMLEGFATTAVLRFKDDFVFECGQDSAGNTTVQGRSRSRVGFTDFGVNAKRIQQYFAKVGSLLE